MAFSIHLMTADLQSGMVCLCIRMVMVFYMRKNLAITNSIARKYSTAFTTMKNHTDEDKRSL